MRAVVWLQQTVKKKVHPKKYLFFEGLLKPNYCSQFDEILYEKIAFKDLLKTFFRINLSLLKAE